MKVDRRLTEKLSSNNLSPQDSSAFSWMFNLLCYPYNINSPSMKLIAGSPPEALRMNHGIHNMISRKKLNHGTIKFYSYENH